MASPITKLKQEKVSAEPLFPLTVFPKEMAETLVEVARYKKFSINYLASCYLVACGSAFDRKYILDPTPNNHTAFPATWLIIVGTAGSSKSAPQDLCFKPFYDHTSKEVDKHEEAQNNQTQLKGSKMINSKANKIADPNVRITSNATSESLMAICSKQQTGILVHTDEILSFINSMDAYRGGKNAVDRPFWLSVFNGNPYISTRKTTGTSVVKNTTISITGSIQFKQITKAFESSEDTSGFLDRFLFTCDSTKPPKWSPEDEAPKHLTDRIQESITTILNDDSEQTNLKLSSGAVKLMCEWQNSIVDEMNTVMNEAEIAAAKKDEIYINRFALLIHLMNTYHQVPRPDKKFPIEKDSVKKAILLIEYFKENRELIRGMIQDQDGEVDYDAILLQIKKAKGQKDMLRSIVKKYRVLGVPVRFFSENMKQDRSTIHRWINH